MKKFMALIVLVSVASGIARADVYEDRLRAAEQRQAWNESQKLIAKFNQDQAKKMAAIRQFGRAYSGYASQPACSDFSYIISEWGLRSQQVCSGNFCVSVKGSGMTFSGHEGDFSYVKFATFQMGISHCSVVLNNGLACQISADWDKHTYGGNCIDANGRQRRLSVPFKP